MCLLEVTCVYRNLYYIAASNVKINRINSNDEYLGINNSVETRNYFINNYKVSDIVKKKYLYSID